MARQFDAQAEGGKLVIASHNPGKVKEIGDLLGPYGVTTVSAGDLGLEEPEEDGASFAENAKLKALAAAEAAKLPALADDSGLSVAALEGFPGIYSARWAGPEKDFALAMERVHEAMADTVDRSGRFVCALALAWPDGHCEVFQGAVGGLVIWPPRGENGFGYDPIFVPDGYEETFGEMDPAEKHAISHRAEAFRKLVAGCFGEP
ncbi:RdgB/HAM1 family non-canonical purine NTP pyrophosphatase [Marivibrio halodurans]|uniref:dITP/XTP pyrophosphatase n=1 Tax=Marivibrio halodurans TaxID=2039722 RepID=A0A8J7V2R6_9PROT|nr:RdgB/HAM1 family non-canonical purine NTP pyrophosphatase [Marivibrio halodurans]MBP5859096.1 RdgB/HAM1 family non-canonical purine NTP pyrophosphatase [Marivibrio halodurans]